MSRVLPILFNTDMVRAILDGRKTVTRRLVKPQPSNDIQCPLGYCTDGYKSEIGKFAFGSHENGGEMMFCSPPYKPGDILYVRETWRRYEKTAGYGEAFHIEQRLAYKADENRSEVQKSSEWYEGKWHPSIHMPKEAARIWLKVTDVRVERLQDMKPEDIKKEGMRLTITPDECKSQFDKIGAVHFYEEARKNFSELWNSTLKKSDLDRYGWEASPWVWVIEFERCEKPESEG